MTRGHAGNQWIRTTRGLLQGCPWSMVLLNGIKRMRAARLPNMRLAFFVASRPMWTTATSGASGLLDSYIRLSPRLEAEAGTLTPSAA
jgi:hypothetical protein